MRKTHAYLETKVGAHGEGKVEGVRESMDKCTLQIPQQVRRERIVNSGRRDGF